MRTKIALAALLLATSLWVVAQDKPQTVQITNGPVIEGVNGDSAVIAWSTNVNAGSRVHYGTDPNNLDQLAQAPWGGMTHRVTVKNLKPNTTYYYQVESRHASGTGTETKSNVATFQTSAAGSAMSQGGAAQNPATPQGDQSGWESGKTAGASIINSVLQLDRVDSGSAVIMWKTSVPASAVVRYGTDINNMNQTAQAPWGGTEHRVTLTGLQPNTTYYFQVKSGQAQSEQGATSGSTSYSNKYKFTTPASGAAAQTNVQPQIAQ